MTVLVGIVHDGVAYVGADSYLGDPDHPGTFDFIGDPKIRKVNRSTLIAFCGEADEVPLYLELLQQTIRHQRVTHRWIRDKLALRAQTLAEAGGVELPISDTAFLLVRPGAIYNVTPSLSPYLVPEGVPVALGAGKSIATGAMRAFLRRPLPLGGMRQVLLETMEETAAVCPYVSGPFVVEEL